MKHNGRILRGIQIRKIPIAMSLCEFYGMLKGRPWTGDVSEHEFRSAYKCGGRMGDMTFIYFVQKSLNSQHHCWQYNFVHTWCAFYVHVTVLHRNKLLCNKTDAIIFPKLFLSRNSTCLGQFLCLSSGVFHCTFGTGICHQTCMTYQCRMYSEKLLMIGRGTAPNM
jgi:hypothetical protein